MKKRVLLVVAAIVALIAGAGIAYAAGSGGGGLPGGEPAVWGGGHVDWGPDFGGVQRDFSIVATPEGGKLVYGSFGLGTNPLSGRVTCMRVSGHNVVIGGISANSPYWFIMFMTDNGELAATPDLVSGLYYMDKDTPEIGWAGITRAFPYVCPSWSAVPWDEVPLFNMTSGDIVVQNATQNAQQ